MAGIVHRHRGPRPLPVLVLAFVLLAIACSSDPADTSAGAELFARDSLGVLEGCSTCHSATSRPSVGGPALLDIGAQAGTRIAGLDAEAYLRESILAPTAYFAPGWGEGMPAYGGVLTADELDALVAYLLRLR